MKLIQLTTQEQFDQLRRGDLIVVRWRVGAAEYKQGKETAHYSMVAVNANNELILRKRGDVFFMIDLYLRGESYAAEAYTLSAKEENQ